MAEAFFLARENERVYRTVCATKSHARRDAIRYVEGFLQQLALHSALGTGGLTKSTIVINSQPRQRRRIC
jgi:hypothetical protein